MKTTPETFRRLLKPLQHIARFPGCNHAVIARRDGVGVEELEAALIDLCRGELTRWDDDYLAKIAKKLGVPVAPYVPAKLSPVVADWPAPSARQIAVRRVAKEKQQAAPAPVLRTSSAPAKVMESTPPTRPGNFSRRADFFKVCGLLAMDPELSENQACRQVGVQQGSWAYFKKNNFGTGPIAPEKLSNFLLSAELAKPVRSTPATVAARKKFSAEIKAVVAQDAVKFRMSPLPAPDRSTEGTALLAQLLSASGLRLQVTLNLLPPLV